MSENLIEDGLPNDPVEEPSPEPVTESWSLSRDEWEQQLAEQRQFQQQILDNMQAANVPADQGVDYSSYFPTDPMTGEASVTYEGLDRLVADRAAQIVDQRMGQYEPVLAQTTADRGEQIIQQKFAELKNTIGDFDPVFARELAEGYAATGNDPNTAIQRAAQRAHEFAQAQRQAGIEEYKTTLGNIGQAPREPGANAAGVYDDSQIPDGQDKYKVLADRWAARNRLPN